LDQAITLASSKGFSILASFRDVPTWANQGVIPNDTACGGHGFLEEVDIPHDTPTGAADFQTFVAAVVNRYGGFVRAWELWNEPDLCGFWRGSAEQWRRLVLIPGYQGIVGTGLPATIVAPGISGVGGGIKNHLDDFLTRYDAVSNTQVLEVPIDVYSFHRYASPADVKTSLENADEYFRCTADGAHCTDVYWLTEFGYDNQSQNCGVCWWGNPSDAGNAAVEVYDHCYNHTRFCFKAFYWDLISSSDPPQVDCNCDTSLLNFSDGTPRGRFDTISDYLLVHPSP